MVGLTEIEAPISQMIQSTVGSSIWIIGVITLLVFIIFMVYLGLDLTTGALILIPLIIILTAAGLLPAWVIVGLILVSTVIIALAVKQYTER